MNVMRKVWLAGLALWLAGCSSTSPEPPDPGQVVVATATSVLDQEQLTVTKSGAEPTATEQVSSAAVSLDHAKLLDQLLFSISSQAEGQAILTQMAESRDTGFVAGLIEIMRFQPGLSQEIGATLNTLTRQDLPPDWFGWVEWAGQHPEIESFDGFVGWKANLLAQIDSKFQRFIYEGVKVAPGSRIEEIEWGGVVVDGIPALDNPQMIDPDEADYLVPHERVFGVSLNGDSRAYPARFLDWHEMFNDIIGGEPVSLAYWTLCGAGVLYKTSIDESQLPQGYTLSGGQGKHPLTEGYLTFGSSGFLYRSNKLMYDRNTDTLWHQLLGTPAFGPLVGSGIQLERLPVTLTTWEAWHTAHPETKVMAFETGFVRDYSVGAAYAEYFASPDTMFPVWRRSNLLPTKSWVFTQLINGQPKAYPLSVLERELVVNDTLAGQNLVVIYDEGGLGARVYERAEWRFTPATTEATGVILDETGVEWQVTEAALVRPDGMQLARLPGHMAYWFGWFSFYPQSAVYGVAE